jgi:hypothetical protein
MPPCLCLCSNTEPMPILHTRAPKVESPPLTKTWCADMLPHAALYIDTLEPGLVRAPPFNQGDLADLFDRMSLEAISLEDPNGADIHLTDADDSEIMVSPFAYFEG